MRFPGHPDDRLPLGASEATVLPSDGEGSSMAIVAARMSEVVSLQMPAAGCADQIDDGVNGVRMAAETEPMHDAAMGAPVRR